MKKQVKILALESSCDETAAAVIIGNGEELTISSNIISSQVATHAQYGGVVPEVAARMHVESVLPVVMASLAEAKVKPEELDAVAVTGGPGLVTSLLIGVETAKSLSFAWNKPLIKVNHIEGHIYSSLANLPMEKVNEIFPALAVVVSGGHTELLLMKNHGQYKFIGGTRDDAIGEAFDKVAKMLNLGYPGGPAVSKEAAKVDPNNLKYKLKLPRPMLDSDNLEMSFSGIKTSVLYTVQKEQKLQGENLDNRYIEEMCYEFQEAATDVVAFKTLTALKQNKVKSILLGGGVAANHHLRAKLQLVADQSKVQLYLPEMKYSGDNAVMIGLAAYFHYLNKDFCPIKNFRPDPNWELV